MTRGILMNGARAVGALIGTSFIAAGVQAVEPVGAPKAPAKALAAPAKPLDLRIGDIRKYMTPEEFQALSMQPDESNTVVVQADAPLLPMKSDLDVPGGIIAPFWALAHPTQAWRLLLPDARVNIQKIPPPETKIPPPVFRWGP
ncbi:MAG TPA: hypothetical protein VM146_15300 [Steroidobacteraceae bacterium]|nr:hypothetical protein [Steroidobacteraceae bacterium]